MRERAKEVRHIPLLAGDNVRYVVPHQIDKESLATGDIRLQLRVRTPIEDMCNVEVRLGDNLVARHVERYARPGEMVTMVIPQKAYDEVSKADKLTIAVVKR